MWSAARGTKDVRHSSSISTCSSSALALVLPAAWEEVEGAVGGNAPPESDVESAGAPTLPLRLPLFDGGPVPVAPAPCDPTIPFVPFTPPPPTPLPPSLSAMSAASFSASTSFFRTFCTLMARSRSTGRGLQSTHNQSSGTLFWEMS